MLISLCPTALIINFLKVLLVSFWLEGSQSTDVKHRCKAQMIFFQLWMHILLCTLSMNGSLLSLVYHRLLAIPATEFVGDCLDGHHYVL